MNDTNEYPGTLISFEGLDGAGKSTQIEIAAADLRSRGHDVIVLREPGGTRVGELIRAILKADTPTLVDALAPDDEQLHENLSELIPVAVLPDDATPRAQMFLLNASRSQLFETVIRPALKAGKIVIMDRGADSTVAYQAGSGGLDPSEVIANCLQATGGLEPKLTIYCRLEPEVRLARMRARGEAEDAIERSVDFEEVAAMFDFLAQSHPDRFETVDAGRSIEEVAVDVKAHIAAAVRPRQ